MQKVRVNFNFNFIYQNNKNNLLKLVLVLVTLFSINVSSQINCIPKIGDKITSDRSLVNLRESSSLDSNVPMKKIKNNKGYIFFEVVEDGFVNDFVKVKLLYGGLDMSESGLNESLLSLYNHLKKYYDYKFNFSEFFNQITDKEKLSEWFEMIKDDDWFIEHNDWVIESINNKEEESKEIEGYEVEIDTFDIETPLIKVKEIKDEATLYSEFITNWFIVDKDTSKYNDIINNHEKIGFVHKSVIKNVVSMYLFNASVATWWSSKSYLEAINNSLFLKQENDCGFLIDNFNSILIRYLYALKVEKQYFKMIQEASKYNGYYQGSRHELLINELLMQASYFDGNYYSAVNIGKKIINLYKLANNNEKYNYPYSTIRISVVYGLTINSLIQIENYKEALLFSNECLSSEHLQTEYFVADHAYILRSLNKKTEACKFLNNAYLNGNAKAKELILEGCN